MPSKRERRIRVLVTLALLAANLVAANGLLSSWASARLDLTRDRMFSISPATRRLLASHPASGIIGPFHFDAYGDVLPSPITIVRAVRGGGDDSVESIAGGTVEAVIRPPRRLIR